MKKRFSVFIALLIVFALSLTSYKASAVTCNHYQYTGSLYSTSTTGWTYYNSEYHRNYKSELYICSNCHNLYEVKTPLLTSKHTWGSWFDGGHSGARHTAYRYCSGCNGTDTTIYFCSGNPCKLPS